MNAFSIDPFFQTLHSITLPIRFEDLESKISIRNAQIERLKISIFLTIFCCGGHCLKWKLSPWTIHVVRLVKHFVKIIYSISFDIVVI